MPAKLSKIYFEVIGDDGPGSRKPCACSPCQNNSISRTSVNGIWFLDYNLNMAVKKLIQHGLPLIYGQTFISPALGIECATKIAEIMKEKHTPSSLEQLACQAAIRKVKRITQVKHWLDGQEALGNLPFPEELQKKLEDLQRDLWLPAPVLSVMYELIYFSRVNDRTHDCDTNLGASLGTFLSLLYSHVSRHKSFTLARTEFT